MNGLPARAAIGLAGAAAISLAARRAGALSPGGAMAATGSRRQQSSRGRGSAAARCWSRSSSPRRCSAGSRPADPPRTAARQGTGCRSGHGQRRRRGGPGPGIVVDPGNGAARCSSPGSAEPWRPPPPIPGRPRSDPGHGTRPRSILTLRPTAPGASGGVTMAGLTASAVGAALIAGMASAPFARASRHPSMRAIPIALGGFTGALVDSVLGATVQEVRFCDACAVETEERRPPLRRANPSAARAPVVRQRHGQRARHRGWRDDGDPRSKLAMPTAAGKGEELRRRWRQGGARVEYIGRATIRPGTGRAALNVRFGTCPASASAQTHASAPDRWETLR